MEAKIVQKLTTTKPKVGFYCMIQNDKLKVIDIEGGIATMDNGNQYNVDDLRGFVLRYVAVTDKNEQLHLDYTDYGKVSDGQVMEGYKVTKPRNAHQQDLIRVTDINIIDRDGLHDIKLRTGEIIRILPNTGYNTKYEILMENGRLYKLYREQFILLEGFNAKKYFHVRCPECGM